ncbi:hypothetical protein ASG11_09855 [Sphingomonas sp. Leaf357]|uniref:hypothetical protein n=1 Tax=Sphingomonas sp. Leaf357 TaxID=1736350 RepID=UPI000701F2C2|nr:hypothetical protein [Sphingomonas sp. Leaf357]KQS04514.1 hypothetical protein ASG11_09855 [Sphingomonas sp. Leaf357]
MADILQFPRRETRGVIAVYECGDRFEIGHESASGGSWGSFSNYDEAGEAIAAAHALNRDVYEGVCAVEVSPAVRAAMSGRGA